MNSDDFDREFNLESAIQLIKEENKELLERLSND